MEVGTVLIWVTDAVQQPSCLEIETRRREIYMVVASFVAVVATLKILLLEWDVSFSFAICQKARVYYCSIWRSRARMSTVKKK